MADRISKAKRSEIMARVKQKNTKPEIAVRSLLHKMGYRFRLHRKDLPGKPDITLSKYKAIIFVHGCFWHGHNCRKGTLPRTHKVFWRQKIQGNQKRDRVNIIKLQDLDFRVMVVWECEIINRNSLSQRFNDFLK
mgnify:CR=1 FL=1